MSKSLSHHFHGTTGERRFLASQGQTESDIIRKRVQDLDLREHPVKHKSTLSRKKIKEKIDNRTATKDDYKKYYSLQRLAKRRKKGVNDFWKQERLRIKKENLLLETGLQNNAMIFFTTEYQKLMESACRDIILTAYPNIHTWQTKVK